MEKRNDKDENNTGVSTILTAGAIIFSGGITMQQAKTSNNLNEILRISYGGVMLVLVAGMLYLGWKFKDT